MASILLIKTSKTNLPDKGLAPPLGILSLIAYLRQHRPNDRFRMLDLRTTSDYAQALAAVTRDFQPDIIGFSSLTIEVDNLHTSAAWCKQKFPSCIIIAGGPHPSSFGPQVVSDPNIDYALAGEGEIAFLKFVTAIEQGNRAPDISGLCYLGRNGQTVSFPPNQELVDLTTLPFPAWDLIDFNQYVDQRMSAISHGKYAVLFTSRGCPYQCTYCHNIFTKRFRAMPAGRVVDDLERLINTYGIREFEFFDDSFNLDYDRATAIFDEIIRRNLNIRILFPNGVRGDLLDEALIRKMRQAGTVYLVFAVESASPRIQKEIKKYNKLDKIKENIRLAAREGIFTWGFFMMGFINETRRELWQTAWFAITSKLHGGFFFVVVPQVGTELARQAGLNVADYATIKATDYFATKNTLARVSHYELWLWQSLTCLVFYAHPGRIYRITRDFPYSYSVFFIKVLRSILFLTLTFFRNFIYALLPHKKKGKDS